MQRLLQEAINPRYKPFGAIMSFLSLLHEPRVHRHISQHPQPANIDGEDGVKPVKIAAFGGKKKKKIVSLVVILTCR